MPIRAARTTLAGPAVAVAVALAVVLSGCSSSTAEAPAPAAGTGAAASTATSDPTVSPDPSGSASSDPEAAKLLSDATAALVKVDTYSVKGTGSQGSSAFQIDMGFQAGVGSAGSIAVGARKATLRIVGGKVYVQLTPASLSSLPAPIASRARTRLGKWLEVPGSSAQQFQQFAGGRAFAQGLLQANGSVTKGETGEIGGKPAVALVSSNGGRLWVATTGDPLPLKLETSPSGGSRGELLFDYTTPVTVAAPPASDVVSLAALAAGGSGG